MGKSNSYPLSRKDFIRALGVLSSALIFSSFLEACSKIGFITPAEMGEKSIYGIPSSVVVTRVTSSPQGKNDETFHVTQTKELDQGEPMETTSPTSISNQDRAYIAFVKTDIRANGVRQALDLLSVPSMKGKSMFLKPNFNSADPAPGSTHPDVLRTIVQELQILGAGSITVGDRSGMGNTQSVMEKLGVFELADELGFDVIVLDDLKGDDWVMFQPPDSHWQHGFPFARPILESDLIIQACCLKTHRYGGHFTLSLKNSVGMVAKTERGDNYNYMSELHSSARQRTLIAEINFAYEPALIVMDGVEAFVNGGPANGKQVASNVVLAGTDRVAMDAVGVAILRYFGTISEISDGPIFELEQISRAVELGLGVDQPEKIEFITDDKDSAAYADQIREILVSHS